MSARENLAEYLDIRKVWSPKVEAIINDAEMAAEKNGFAYARQAVLTVHEERESAYVGGSYCDLCSNHGDITWPCATVKALNVAAQVYE